MEAITNFFKKVVEKPWLAGIGAIILFVVLWLVLELANVVDWVGFI